MWFNFYISGRLENVKYEKLHARGIGVLNILKIVRYKMLRWKGLNAP